MTQSDLLVWVLVAAVAAVFYDAMRLKNRATRTARRACGQHNLQLLDESVVLSSLRMQRENENSWMPVLLRVYRFEFSTDGSGRRQGWVKMRGARVTGVQLELEDGVLHDSH